MCKPSCASPPHLCVPSPIGLEPSCHGEGTQVLCRLPRYLWCHYGTGRGNGFCSKIPTPPMSTTISSCPQHGYDSKLYFGKFLGHHSMTCYWVCFTMVHSLWTAVQLVSTPQPKTLAAVWSNDSFFFGWCSRPKVKMQTNEHRWRSPVMCTKGQLCLIQICAKCQWKLTFKWLDYIKTGYSVVKFKLKRLMCHSNV